MTHPLASWPSVIVHRGGGALAPENTLAGLRLAARLGAGAVEFDAMLSADGVPVLIHDETLARTTNGVGRVADTPLEQLSRLDAGMRFGPAFAGEPLPRLDEALALCARLALRANVEIKPSAGLARQTGLAVAACARRWARAGSVLLSSFSPDALDAARELAPALPRGLLVEDISPDWRERCAELGCVALIAAAVAAWPAPEAESPSGIARWVYTENDPTRLAALRAAGVSGVITDRPDLLLPGGVA